MDERCHRRESAKKSAVAPWTGGECWIEFDAKQVLLELQILARFVISRKSSRYAL